MFKSKNRYRESHVYGAFAVGALAGAAVALLFAPSTGSETRDAIAERVNDVSRRLRTAQQRMMQRMNGGAGTGELPAGVWPGTPSQAEAGTDYESERGNGGE